MSAQYYVFWITKETKHWLNCLKLLWTKNALDSKRRFSQSGLLNMPWILMMMRFEKVFNWTSKSNVLNFKLNVKYSTSSACSKMCWKRQNHAQVKFNQMWCETKTSWKFSSIRCNKTFIADMSYRNTQSNNKGKHVDF